MGAQLHLPAQLCLLSSSASSLPRLRFRRFVCLTRRGARRTRACCRSRPSLASGPCGPRAGRVRGVVVRFAGWSCAEERRKRSGLTQTSARVACRQLGYAAGAASTSPCSSYGGSNVCGSAGSSVAMKNVKCNGGEAAIQECPWADPDAECASHLSDSVVFCTNHKPDEAVAEGTLRLQGPRLLFSGHGSRIFASGSFPAGPRLILRMRGSAYPKLC